MPKHWSATDSQRACEMYKQGYRLARIGQEVKRTEMAVRDHLRRQGYQATVREQNGFVAADDFSVGDGFTLEDIGEAIIGAVLRFKEQAETAQELVKDQLQAQAASFTERLEKLDITYKNIIKNVKDEFADRETEWAQANSNLTTQVKQLQDEVNTTKLKKRYSLDNLKGIIGR